MNQQQDWFYQPAEPLYIGKHEPLYPAPITGGYGFRRYRFSTRVIHAGRMVKVPQVDLMTKEEPPTWEQLLKRIALKAKKTVCRCGNIEQTKGNEQVHYSTEMEF